MYVGVVYSNKNIKDAKDCMLQWFFGEKYLFEKIRGRERKIIYQLTDFPNGHSRQVRLGWAVARGWELICSFLWVQRPKALNHLSLLFPRPLAGTWVRSEATGTQVGCWHCRRTLTCYTMPAPYIIAEFLDFI